MRARVCKHWSPPCFLLFLSYIVHMLHAAPASALDDFGKPPAIPKPKGLTSKEREGQCRKKDGRKEVIGDSYMYMYYFSM